MIEVKEKKIKKEMELLERKERREDWPARVERERLDLVRSKIEYFLSKRATGSPNVLLIELIITPFHKFPYYRFQERDKYRERQAEGKSPTHPREEGAPTPPWDPTPDRE